jgi:membrane protease YdiL (CAAX protease family)
MVSGANASLSYSGRSHPDQGLFRLISAMTEICTASGCRVTARKKFRGGSACATRASISSIRVVPFTRAISSRFRAIVALKAPGSSAIGGIVAASLLLATGTAKSAQIDPTSAPLPPSFPIISILLIAAAIGILIALWAADVIRPGSFRRRGRRIVTSWPWPVWLTGGFLTFVAGALAASIASAILHFRPHDDLTRLAAVQFAVGVVTSIVGCLLLTRGLPAMLGPHTPPPMGTQPRISSRALGIGVLALLFTLPVVHTISVIAVVVSTAIKGSPPEIIAHDTLRAMVDNPQNPAVWALVASAVLLAPISEEVLFRGFLQSFFLRVLGSSWGAILLAAALFALAHVGAGITEGQEHAIAPIFILGVAMGIAYERTRNLVVPILMHLGFNALNVLLAILLS